MFSGRQILKNTLLLTAAACAPRPAQLEVLTIGTADSGGTMYPVGRAIAGAMASETRKLNVGASTGSEKNIADLSSGEIDLGLVTADAAYDALQAGTAEGLRAIGAVYVSVSTWLAPADSGLLYVHDITAERLGVGPENSVTEQTAQVSLEVLKTDGVSPTLENCSLEQGWLELAEGKLDAVHGFVGTPAEGLVNLNGHRSIGGMRASIYNAMPMEGVDALIDFMKKFEEENK